MSYDWAVPSDQVTIGHPAEMPVPHLAAIYVGDHPEGDTPFQRISFYFRGGFPEYNLQYVRSVLGEGTGTPISLQGNAFLRVGFVNAQAHDDAGASTVQTAPDTSIGFTNLKSYDSAGDFEGHVTYGLGIQVAPDSDQVLLVRAGELTKPDDSDGLYHVIYVDLQTG
ncbi:MAG: AMIN-like domain-containing (lipo)protein [Jiangellaceae bacterium]